MVKFMNYWSWVTLALQNKVSVCRASWKKDQYLESPDGINIIYHNVKLTLDDYNANDWQSYTKKYTLADMKVGQKFRCKQCHGNLVLMKICVPEFSKNEFYKKYQEYVSIETGEFWHCNTQYLNEFEVEPV